MKFGFHISIAGGFSKVVKRAKITMCETIQLFSRNPRGWSLKLLDRDEVKKFKQGVNDMQISQESIHPFIGPYFAFNSNCPIANSFNKEFTKKNLLTKLKL